MSWRVLSDRNPERNFTRRELILSVVLPLVCARRTRIPLNFSRLDQFKGVRPLCFANLV